MKVMKFGGSTIARAEGMQRAAEIIHMEKDTGVVIVVSAMDKTTDDLLKCYNDLIDKNIAEAFAGLKRIEDQHVLVTSRLIYDINKFYDVNLSLYKLFDEVRSVFVRIASRGENSPDAGQDKAKVLSYGELFSTTILSGLLDYLNIKNKLLDAREIIITDSDYLKASPDFESIKERTTEIVKPVLNSGSVAVIQGFIGSNGDGDTTLLGFEGSDFTASILGNALDAEKIIIWTDVDGVLSADPKIIGDAVTINKLDYDEARDLAYYGAKVLHPLTAQPACEKNIPILIKNPGSPSSEGTCIDCTGDNMGPRVKSITFKENIRLVEIKSYPHLSENGIVNKIFSLYNKENNTIHLIQKSDNKLSFIIDEDGSNGKFIDYRDEMKSRSLVTLVGRDIGNDRKINTRISEIKKRTGAQTIPSMSNNNICLLVERKECYNILKDLHKEFILDCILSGTKDIYTSGKSYRKVL